MKRLFVIVSAACIAAACSDSTGPDPDAIDGNELAAVRYALDQALVDDSLYPTLSALVFPFIDRASHVIGPDGDTTRVVTVELDINATGRDTAGVLDTLDVDFTVVLAWTDYRPASRTVDTVFLILGAGKAPVDDTLRESFSPDTAGTGTGVVVNEAPDSTVTQWLARAGHLRTTTSTYGAATPNVIGSLTLTPARGSVSGEFAITADLVPGGATTVAAVKDYRGGAQGVRMQIRGDLGTLP